MIQDPATRSSKAVQAGPSRSALTDLRAHPVFASVPAQALSGFLASLDQEVLAPGSPIIVQGEAADAMWLVCEGDLRPNQDAARPLLIGQEAAGLAHYDTTVSALGTVVAWRMPREAVQQLCQQVPGLEATLTHSLQLGVTPQTRLAEMPPTPRDKPGSARHVLGWLLALILPPGLVLGTQAAEMAMQTSLFLAIFGMVITMWVFSLVDDYIAPLAGLVCMLFVGLAPPTVLLASFSSPSLLTLISVFALAAMLSSTGLSNRVLLWLLIRLPDRSSWRQLTLLLYGLMLSLGTPSANNRMALMWPAFEDMARGLRLRDRSVQITALFVGTYGGAMLFSSTLATSKSATITALGFLPPHQQDYYAGMFWISAAALLTVGVVLLHMIGVRYWLHQPERSQAQTGVLRERMALLGPLSVAEKTTALVFMLFLLGSLTSSLHHVPQSSMAGAVLVGLLVVGVMSKTDFQKRIDWPMIVFLIATDCLIRVMAYLGLSEELAGVLRDQVSFVDGDVTVFIALTLVVVLGVRLLLPIPAGMLLSAVMLLPLAEVQGISPWICIFTIAVFSDLWFFRYQNSIYGIAVSAGVESRIDVSVFMRHNLWMNAARVLMVFLSIPLWRWMGLA